MENKIKEVLETVRPMLQRDGGDVEFVKYETNGTVKVRLKGACNGCPGAQMTLKSIIESVLKEELPEIKSVEGV